MCDFSQVVLVGKFPALNRRHFQVIKSAANNYMHIHIATDYHDHVREAAYQLQHQHW